MSDIKCRLSLHSRNDETDSKSYMIYYINRFSTFTLYKSVVKYKLSNVKVKLYRGEVTVKKFYKSIYRLVTIA